MTYEELMQILPNDVLDNRIFVVEYAIAPTWNKRTISDRATVLRGFFLPGDVIYSVRAF